jgi:hypothetical protein
MQGPPVRQAIHSKTTSDDYSRIKQSLQEEAERIWTGTAIALYN